jgi:hypothetical protein
MVGGELHDEEAQSLKDMMEKAAQPTPQKSKKKQMGKDEACMNKKKAHEKCCNPNLGLTTKTRPCKVAGQEGKPKNHISCSRECRRVRRNEPSHS